MWYPILDSDIFEEIINLECIAELDNEEFETSE